VSSCGLRQGEDASTMLQLLLKLIEKTAPLERAKVDTWQLGLSQIGFFEVWLDLWMLSSPLIPRSYSLPEYVEVLSVCHAQLSFLLSFTTKVRLT
jgi:hypothetical protein